MRVSDRNSCCETINTARQKRLVLKDGCPAVKFPDSIGSTIKMSSTSTSNKLAEKTSSSPSTVPKATSKGKRKQSKSKKSTCRKQYKKLKPRLRRLIEEGVMLQQTLSRKQEKMIEMSRDIHYILGRLLPYQKKLTTPIIKPKEVTAPPGPSLPTLADQTEVKCEASEVLNWDGFVECSEEVGAKSHLNLCLSAEVERQLASIISDKTPLTLPDNIFSET